MQDCTFKPQINKSTFKDRRESRSVQMDSPRQLNDDLFNNSDRDDNMSKMKSRGDGRSPVDSRRFERLYGLRNVNNQKLEQRRKEEAAIKDNEFDFKPKLYKSGKTMINREGYRYVSPVRD